MYLIKFTVSFYILCECGVRFISGVRLYEKNNTDSYLNSLQMIQKYGYRPESHFAVTEDGYILELHRIAYGKNSNSVRRRTPVYIQHGLLGSSADFLLLGPGKAISYLLADEGYDVWMGNLRGNRYSRAHKYLTPSDREFWDFTWHESGVYDLPAQIDYICNYTQQNDLIYIGYSMGTTMFYVMASSRPEYQQKVRSAILLAPVGYLKHIRTPLRFLAPFAYNLQLVAEFLADGELNPQSTVYRYLTRLTCTLNKLERDLCRNLIFIYTGCDPYQFNEDLLPSLLNHVPAGSSAKTVTHYAQLVQSGKFQQFDYGPKKNLRRYNSTTPPQYNVEAITIPLYMFVGQNDFLSTLKDVQRLVKRLPNVKVMDIIDYKYFNHLDFVLANDVKPLLYNKVIHLLDNIITETEQIPQKGYEEERVNYDSGEQFPQKEYEEERVNYDSGEQFISGEEYIQGGEKFRDYYEFVYDGFYS